MIRIQYEDMYREFLRVLLTRGLAPERAKLCAKLFTDTSPDGVYTHGLNRFPKFIGMIDRGVVKADAQAKMEQSFGCLERWNGNEGIGNLNAYTSMSRAVELAKTYTIGCVALKNTNHWMRPGAYGLLAADSGCIGVCWTNTLPNMPPWGGTQPKIGNNPLVIAIAREGGHVLLDVAMSLFSYGRMETLALQGKQLPFDGGFDEDGNLTKDPTAILKSQQSLPIGFWKGAGLSIMLDLIAATLSGGNTTSEIGKLPVETAVSQVFLAIDISRFPDRENIARSIETTVADLAATAPRDASSPVRYPGAGMMKTREENLAQGIPAIEGIWQQVLAL
jgi:3-dehydro-L-gulonate 2-dehydrogenase